MPTVGSEISGTTSILYANQDNPTPTPHIFKMSDGYLLAIWVQSNSEFAWTIYNGSSWASPVLTTAGIGTAKAPYLAQNGNTIVAFTTSTTYKYLFWYVITYNATSHTASIGAQQSVSTGSSICNNITGAVYDTSTSQWYIDVGEQNPCWVVLSSTMTLVAVVQNASLLGTQGILLSPAPGGAAGTYLQVTNNGVSGGNLNTGTFTTTSPYITANTAETFTPSGYPLASTDQVAATTDSSGKTDIIFVSTISGTTGLYTVKRLGTGSYGTVTTLDGNIGGANPFTLQYDTATGNLTVYYQTTKNQANGEVYSVSRAAGTWGTPTLVAGGDANGYTNPTGAPITLGGNNTLLYTYGYSGSAANGEYALLASLGAAPNTPVVSAPSGSVGATGSPPTPTLTAAYSDSVASDAQSAWEWKVVQTSNSATMWDSGKVAGALTSVTYGTGSNTGDVNYVAPSNLVYGTQYQAQARYWDTVLNTASAWSAAVTFTLYQAPTTNITSLVSPSGSGNAAQTAAPFTIQGTTADITFTMIQAQGHSLSSYYIQLLSADGSTVIDQTGTVTPSPADASGTSVTVTGASFPHAVTGTTYLLKPVAVDSVTSIAGGTTFAASDTATPPTAPTGVSATPNATAGRTLIQWTAGGGGQSVIQRRLTGTSAWTTLTTLTTTNGTAYSLYDYAPLLTAVDYAVVSQDSVSLAQSAPVIAADVTLPLHSNRYGIVLTDTSSLTTVWAGGFAQGNEQYATAREIPAAIRQYVPSGAANAIVRFGAQAQVQMRGRKWQFGFTEQTAAGTLSGPTQVGNLEAMCLPPHTPVLYRDMRGNVHLVVLYNYHEQLVGQADYEIWLDMDGVQGSTILVSTT